jgi:hypothetical protein
MMPESALSAKYPCRKNISAVELNHNVMKGAEYFLSLQTSAVITEECNVMVNSGELIGTTAYLTV